MTDGGQDLFEGPEKKLEMALSAPIPDFRSGAQDRWREVVAASGASVVSRIGNDAVDAYLLSESSLFVWADRLLLITCGRTNPLNALPVLLGFIPAEAIGRVFYFRKNFMFPQLQVSDFEAEVATILPYFNGKSFRLGPANDDHLHLFYSTDTDVTFKRDLTFEMLMRGLPEETRSGFSRPAAASPRPGATLARLHDLVGDMAFDEFFFTPEGYSLNAIRDHHYFTVHVTPQRPGSYASMETNLPPSDIAGIMAEMLRLFRPARVTLALTTSMDRNTRGAHDVLNLAQAPYDVVERSRYQFDCGYMVSFGNYQRTGG